MSFKVYDITQTELKYDGYKVKINGTEVVTDTARVSAMPFNRRWPGHQRSVDQTELVNFVSLETDESVEFEVTLPEKSDNVVVRPLSLGIKPEFKNEGTVVFTLKRNAYFTLEPYGRKNALHIFADPISEYNIDFGGDNVIYFGKGEHHAGTINLKNNQIIFIDEGAVVYGCIRAKDAENIKILGRGILDNSHNKEQILFKEYSSNNTTAVKNVIRHHTVQLEKCNGIEIEGITIRDSLVYNIRPLSCTNLKISNVKLIGNWRYNSDGIDMHNCVNVDIDNCFVRTFDDCICVKGYDPSYKVADGSEVFKNACIKNCVLWNDWGRCLEIGAETQAEEIENIVFEDCDVIHVTMPVLECQNVDYAYIHNVTYRNINVEYDDIIPECIYQHGDDMPYEPTDTEYAPPVIVVSVSYHPEYSAKYDRRGKNQNISFENINLCGRQVPKIEIQSYSREFASKDIIIKNFYYNGKIAKAQDFDIHSDSYSTYKICDSM
ncbi:MAG: hypothetical protein IKJ68_03065 [Clostridia bacterium]|nr:hypothetical protein [Clostridia bacterium]